MEYIVTVNGKTYRIERYSPFKRAHALKFEFANYRIHGKRGAVGGFQIHRLDSGKIRITGISGMEHLPALRGQELFDELIRVGAHND